MKIFVTTLERTPTRWAEFRAQNKELSVIKFTACDGQDPNVRKRLIAEGSASEDLLYSPGAFGCLASHVELWRRAAGERAPVIILEDDAVAHRDLELLFYRLRESLPAGWDHVALGYNLDYPVQLELLPSVTQCRVSFSAEAGVAELKTFKTLELRPTAYRLQLCFGTPGYALSPAGARKLLATVLPVTNFSLQAQGSVFKNVGVDVALVPAYAKLESYASFPPLVLTPNNKKMSTVQQS